MDLELFSDDLGGGGKDPNKPPSVISAGKLDRNFQRCLPVKMDGNNVAYKADYTDGGWKLIGSTTFDVCENGQPVKYRFFAEKV